MKRIFLMLAILFSAMSFTSASSIKALGRGGAVITSPDASYAFSYNPASVGYDEYSFDFPISVGLNNASSLFSNNFIRNIFTLSSLSKEDMANSILSILRDFYSRMPLLQINEELSFSVNGFGLSLALDEGIIVDNGSLSTSVSGYIDTTLSSAVGLKKDFGNDYGIALGFSPKLKYRIYTNDLSVETLVEMMNENNISNVIAISDDMMFSFDAGLIANFPYSISLAAAIRDISPDPDEKIKVDAAISWRENFSIVSLDIELGLRAVNLIRDEVDLYRSLNAGLSVGITDFITLMAGLSSGYPSFGLSLDIFFFEINAAYYYRDFGSVYGINARDTLAIEIALSF